MLIYLAFAEIWGKLNRSNFNPIVSVLWVRLLPKGIYPVLLYWQAGFILLIFLNQCTSEKSFVKNGYTSGMTQALALYLAQKYQDSHLIFFGGRGGVKFIGYHCVFTKFVVVI